MGAFPSAPEPPSSAGPADVASGHPGQRAPAAVLTPALPPGTGTLHSPGHGYRGALPMCTQGQGRGLKGQPSYSPRDSWICSQALPGTSRPPGKVLQGTSAMAHPRAFVRERECSFPTVFPSTLIPSLLVKQELFPVGLPAPSGVFAQPSSSRIPAGPWLLSCSDPNWLTLRSSSLAAPRQSLFPLHLPPLPAPGLNNLGSAL